METDSSSKDSKKSDNSPGAGGSISNKKETSQDEVKQEYKETKDKVGVDLSSEEQNMDGNKYKLVLKIKQIEPNTEEKK